jgi:heme/copper-type cytochrome/quinol oxidase subunit 2
MFAASKPQKGLRVKEGIMFFIVGLVLIFLCVMSMVSFHREDHALNKAIKEKNYVDVRTHGNSSIGWLVIAVVLVVLIFLAAVSTDPHFLLPEDNHAGTEQK